MSDTKSFAQGVGCVQPESEFARIAAKLNERVPNASLFFLGIAGQLHNVDGSFVLRYKSSALRYAGVALYLKNTSITCSEAKDLDTSVKYFIDGIEKLFGRPVLLVGGPADPRRRTVVNWILNENRWPQKADATDTTISSAESEE